MKKRQNELELFGQGNCVLQKDTVDFEAQHLQENKTCFKTNKWYPSTQCYSPLLNENHCGLFKY